MQRFVLKTAVGKGFAGTACDFLSGRSGISRGRIKDAMNKGAVWIKRKGRGKLLRLRRQTSPLLPGDYVELHYDEGLLSIAPPEAECIEDLGEYSVWRKPSGVMAQGTAFGDHCSLLRQAELFFGNSREVFLVHRLDREASGVMLLAHTGAAAARLSALFRENRIVKKYRAAVLGDLSRKGGRGMIDLPLDGKKAVTEFEVVSYSQGENTSTVDVVIHTGRLHQIRRHFAMIGFPVIGDPKYGKGNKNAMGLQLFAVSLGFRCPFTGSKKEFASQPHD